MACCEKTTKKIKNVAAGYTNLVLNRHVEMAKKRAVICVGCIYNYYLGRTLWCKICKCWIPAAVRAGQKECPKGFWKLDELPAWARKGN